MVETVHRVARGNPAICGAQLMARGN
jgi:hypothetical protein